MWEQLYMSAHASTAPDVYENPISHPYTHIHKHTSEAMRWDEPSYGKPGWSMTYLADGEAALAKQKG